MGCVSSRISGAVLSDASDKLTAQLKQLYGSTAAHAATLATSIKDATRSHPPLALWDRAVTLPFLELLVELKVGKRKLGDFFTHEVVSDFVKPLTSECKVCYIEALREGHVRLPWTSVNEDGTVCLTESGQSAVLPSTYFVSHAWSYRFKDLVQLIKQHASSTSSSTGRLGYWLDILAVTQNFTGKFENNADGDFAGVIKASQGLLLTIHPFVQPKTPTRVWCLFEVMNAVELGKAMDLVLDPLFGKTRAYEAKTTLTSLGASFESSVIARLDVGLAEATVLADKVRILEQVHQQAGGIPHFNDMLKKALRSAVKNALLAEAVHRGDVESAEDFIASGAKLHCTNITPPATMIVGAVKVLCLALRSGSRVCGIHLVASSAAGLGPGSVPTSQRTAAVSQLMEAIDDAGVVSRLSLCRLNLADAEAKMIARSVAKMSCTLEYLDISGNNFTEDGMTALSHGLADNYSRTGCLTDVIIDMPRARVGQDAVRAALVAANPHVHWVGGRIVGGLGAAGGSVKADKAIASLASPLGPASSPASIFLGRSAASETESLTTVSATSLSATPLASPAGPRATLPPIAPRPARPTTPRPTTPQRPSTPPQRPSPSRIAPASPQRQVQSRFAAPGPSSPKHAGSRTGGRKEVSALDKMVSGFKKIGSSMGMDSKKNRSRSRR